MPESETDVLIVGAGPVGLLMAVELRRHGLEPRIIDRSAAPSAHSKALGVQMRTLEIMADLGLIEDCLARGLQLHGMNVFASGKRIAHVDLADADTPYPFVLVLPQYETEKLLIRRLESLGGAVEREVEAVGLEQSSAGVSTTVHLRNGQSEVIRSRWVVGCDGSHSFVRTALGVPYEGENMERTFCFADVDADMGVERDEGYAYLNADGLMLWLPLPEPDRWRLVVSTQKDPAETLAGLEQDARERSGREITLGERHWETSFQVRQRKVDRYRLGRVFLAGDSAHCHSPLGGQGMNTGLQDAYNLAWKLALVDRGDGVARLLDSYESEREPVAKDLLRGTGRATKVVTLRHPVSRAVRNRVARFLASFEAVRRRAAHDLGELVIGYRDSPIVAQHRKSVLLAEVRSSPTTERPSIREWRDFGAAPKPGERAPDCALADGRHLHDVASGTAHTLLLFDGAAPTASGYRTLTAAARRVTARYPGRVEAHVIVPGGERPDEMAWSGSVLFDSDGDWHARYGASAECVYLIRPDGYVGYRAQPIKVERLMAFLAKILT